MISISEADFDEALGEATDIVLVDFWADWCGPCHAVAPVLTELSEVYSGKVDFWKVNADENPRLMSAFGVSSLPSVLLLAPRKDRPGAAVLGHAIGTKSRAGYLDMIERALNPPPSLMDRFRSIFKSG